MTDMSDQAFRSEVRSWFADNPPAPPLGHSVGQKRDYDADDVAQQRQWLKRLAEAGLSGIAWPTEYGGRGATPMQQLIFHEEHQRVGGRGGELFFVGVSHAGPTLIEHGTDAQRRQWLPGILNGDILFAQCFSEPGAGSDLASITTRGTVDADDLVITGEKRWSTHAQHADLCELLVRTDPADRYGGLTYLIADLRTPGITVRPIRTITGAAEFCEVFFDGARIPLANVVGSIGQGWAVATTTLMYERSTAFAANDHRPATNHRTVGLRLRRRSGTRTTDLRAQRRCLRGARTALQVRRRAGRHRPAQPGQRRLETDRDRAEPPRPSLRRDGR